MKEVPLARDARLTEAVTFAACIAAILELPLAEVPTAGRQHDPAGAWTLSRWLGGLGLGLIPVADPKSFSWAGPWIARIRPASGGERRAVVMYGVPSGPAWDPAGVTQTPGWQAEDGFVIAPLDVALARPPRPAPPQEAGTVEALWIAPAAGQAVRTVPSARALAGQGLEGDRHVAGTGTFPSGLPGSALTLIQAEVCESFEPPLTAGEHRRNVVTRGIDLGALAGREFTIGATRCRGMRLCEPCMVIERYATRPVLRSLIHRGGLRADILTTGTITTGDPIYGTPG